MRIAVVGGGINGVMSAWALARRGHLVTLFEAGELMGATSSHSTKLLHGGLRYLEHGQLRLVRSSLQAREWWIQQAPQLAKTIEMVLPVYAFSQRPCWKIRIGLALYEWLAGGQKLGRHLWHARAEAMRLCPELNPEGLIGIFSFYDGQMHDRELGLWAASQAEAAGVVVRAHSPVDAVSNDGKLTAAGKETHFDRLVNVAGPWARRLLDRSRIDSKYNLDLVRGSHLLLKHSMGQNYILEVPGEERVCFALNYKGQALIGTTEVRQSIDEPIECSTAERDYLIRVYNRYFTQSIGCEDIDSEFAGVRPLVLSHHDPSRASREYVIERQASLFNVFGGKWTTARLLGEDVADQIERSS